MFENISLENREKLKQKNTVDTSYRKNFPKKVRRFLLRFDINFHILMPRELLKS